MRGLSLVFGPIRGVFRRKVKGRNRQTGRRWVRPVGSGPGDRSRPLNSRRASNSPYITRAFGLDQAISTGGGVAWDALDGFMLKALPGVFAAGEMLDWEAPTGGYLLTACLATGRAAGDAAADWLVSHAD